MNGELRILEGSTFCICDEIGDLLGETSGLFAEDMRFLSHLKLTMNSARPLLLTSGRMEYFSAAFFLRNPLAGGLPQDVLSIKRERFVGEGMQDHIVVQNQSMEKLTFHLGLEVGSDFADIMSVKAHDFSLGDPANAPPLPKPVPPRYDETNNQFVLVDPEGFGRTQLIFSRRGTTDGRGMSWQIELEPKEVWDVRVDIAPLVEDEERAPRVIERRFGEERGRVRDSLAAWQLRVPQLRASWDDLSHSFGQSVADLASLRIRSNDLGGIGRLPAAGCPWFMTVFGRDTLITCLQTLLFGPELARGALEVLADLQSHEDDPTRDAEPGKIVHEVRRGKSAKKWFDRNYGTVDATPLYLILLSEVWRDPVLAARLEAEADALKLKFDEAFWVDERGGYYALALDRDKQRVDSLCSNIGHLLWSGIVPPHRVDQVVDRLMGDELWSGWGIRTMSSGDAAYNPLAYHNGTVWPHDNSLCAWGLARYARWPEAHRVIRTMLGASGHFNYQLPEVFAGMPRSETSFPIAYPTAARPQAWAAGTPVLMLQLLMGLQPDRRRQSLETVAPLELPAWTGSVRLAGVRAFDRVWDARLDDGRVVIEAA